MSSSHSVRGEGGMRGRDEFADLRSRPGVVGDRAAAAVYELDGREGGPPERLVQASRAVDDPERRVAGLVALDARRDVVGLLAALESTAPEVRRAAAPRLARLRSEPEVTRALAQRAREDTEELVRIAATSALGQHGEEAVEALEALVGDRAMSVRIAAVSALAQASRDRAIARLAPTLVVPRTALAIETARVLAARGHAGAAEYVLGALEDPSAQLRAQAAVAAGGLPSAYEPRIAPHLEDADPEVRVRVCGLLVRDERYRERAVRAMRAAASSVDPRTAVRALVILAEADDGAAAAPLRDALRAPDANVRRLALLAWSRLAGHTGEVDPLVPLLTDADRSVRLMAAAEIVRIAAH